MICCIQTLSDEKRKRYDAGETDDDIDDDFLSSLPMSSARIFSAGSTSRSPLRSVPLHLGGL